MIEEGNCVGNSDTFAAQNARQHWRCSFPTRFRIRRAPNLQQAAFGHFRETVADIPTCCRRAKRS
jgi:hypothetical protein